MKALARIQLISPLPSLFLNYLGKRHRTPDSRPGAGPPSCRGISAPGNKFEPLKEHWPACYKTHKLKFIKKPVAYRLN